MAWAAGSVFGVLAVYTTSYQGPLAEIANGIDLSAVGSGLIAVVVYLVALAVWPSSVDAPEPVETVDPARTPEPVSA